MARTTVRTALADQVAGQLLAMIVNRSFDAGAQLPTEAQLALDSGVSRMTIREAMKALQAKGVVSVEHGRGTFVRPMSSWSVLDRAVLAVRSADQASGTSMMDQLLEARQLVEVGVAELAALRRTNEQLQRMRETVSQMKRAHAAGDVGDFAAADLAFHRALMEATGNEIIAALFEPVGALLVEMRQRASAVVQSRPRALADHERILEAVAVGDRGRAGHEMSKHLVATAVEFAAERRGTGSASD